jgi:hypothetical protein
LQRSWTLTDVLIYYYLCDVMSMLDVNVLNPKLFRRQKYEGNS